MISLTDIRTSFLDYFAKNDHPIVPSSSLVPRNDPTLMFANSGMVQFKNVFTGAETRPYRRATTAQKCVRAGGKHNDLENVGYTARHHTFFEMLGNFSFGDYFKEHAIEMAWNLITREWQLPKEKLLVTVYSEDEEAATFWKKIAGLSDDRIIRIPTSDNFWQMGDTGPCGPCSEIFFDHGDKIPGGPPGSADEDGDRFIEIWNLVFMQFEQIAIGQRESLPRPSIDTGMGLERVAAVLQGKHDNYDVDLLRALIEASAHASHTDPDGPHKVSHRVIADHLRTSCFLVADGVLPSNEGRGYVLRRIMRRAMRHAHILGCREPLMHKLVPVLNRLMGDAYPELRRAEALVTETLKTEETRFKQTLDRGLKLLDDEIVQMKPGGILSGNTAFKLYDTFGFPFDLTSDVLRGHQMTVNEWEFESAMEKQRADARRAWQGSGDVATEKQWFELQDKVGATEFLGYDTEHAEGQIVALLQDGQTIESAKAGDRIAIIVNQTPFYGESGGQVGDNGIMTGANNFRVIITDTQKKLGKIFVHSGTVESGSIKVGDAVELQVDHARRRAIRANHSATHLLHAALRAQLGAHVTQKGSLVAPDRLRFDVSNPKAMNDEDLKFVERAVNNRIQENSNVTTRLMTPDEAIKEGAMALFGEKYGDEVRVVSMGSADDSGKIYSVELCGGTHVTRTGDIGLIKIVGESAVSSGVRRIEALTGREAFNWFAERNQSLEQTAALLKTNVSDVPARVQSLIDDRKKLEQEISNLRRQMVSGAGSNDNLETVNGIQFAHQIVNDIPAKDLKSLVDQMKKKIGSCVAAIASITDGKVSLVVGVTDDLTARISAVDLVRVGAEAIGGKGGGGRPDLAQAGGTDGANINLAIEAMKRQITT